MPICFLGFGFVLLIFEALVLFMHKPTTLLTQLCSLGCQTQNGT